MRDVSAATARTGNHVCRADVCHKGRIGKLGFCRMLFWHWAKFTKENGEAGATRRHGLPLQARWDGQGWPPVLGAPPFRGTSSLIIHRCDAAPPPGTLHKRTQSRSAF